MRRKWPVVSYWDHLQEPSNRWGGWVDKRTHLNNGTYSSLVHYIQNNAQFPFVAAIVDVGNSPNLYKALKHLRHKQKSVKSTKHLLILDSPS